MTTIPLAEAELHNIDVVDGRLQTRNGLQHADSIAGTEYQYAAAFTIEQSSADEVRHVLVKQRNLVGDNLFYAGETTLTVWNEEHSVALDEQQLGVQPQLALFSLASVDRQVCINGPSMSYPLYGFAAGGLVQMTASPSNAGLTALDVPTGTVCAWRGRLVVAQQSRLLVSDGRPDPRTFVAQNVITMPGIIYDLMEGPDGALYVFTSTDAYVIPVDTLAQSNMQLSFIATVPGVNTARPQSACVSNGRVFALAADALQIVTRGGAQRIDVQRYGGRRAFSHPVEMHDMRTEARLFAVRDGVIICPRRGGFYIHVDVRRSFVSYRWYGGFYVSIGDERFYSDAIPMKPIVGVLRSREGADILVTTTELLYDDGGTTDSLGGVVRGVACRRAAPAPGRTVRAQSAFVQSDNVGQRTHAHIGGRLSQDLLVPAVPLTGTSAPGDAVIGTASWSATALHTGRDARQSRHAFAERLADVQLEVAIDGGRRVVSGLSFDADALQGADRPQNAGA